jgi:Copper type II ascorbate-dependent monooxygenase, C-terminal domain
VPALISRGSQADPGSQVRASRSLQLRLGSRSLCGLLLLAALDLSCRRTRPAPSYSQRVAPILERRCLPCHGSSPGAANVSPALDTAEAAQRAAPQLALAVERRRMPPWGADGTGACGRFVDAAWLDDREVSTLRSWADGGAPIGTAVHQTERADAPGPFAWLLEPAPGESRLSLPTQFTPGPGRAATRCFRSDIALEGDWSIGALGLRAQPALSVQQMLLYTLGDSQQLEAVRRLEAEDPEPGWSCYGGTRIEGSALVASWSWLNPLERLPLGSLLHAQAGLPLVLQLRYNLSGAGLAPRAVQASAELVLRPPQRQARLWPVSAPELRLPAGQRRAEVAHEVALSERLELLGVVPQLHGLGRAVLLERQRGAERQCLVSLSDWNPSQEQLFRYRTPFDLDPGDRLRLSCVFDTTSRTEEVRGGEDIDQEECRVYLYVSERQ